MSGTLKAGLMFSLIGLIVVAGVTFIPSIGPICCGPIVALIVAVLAGYYGVRWNDGPPRIGRGVLAGAIAGIGTLIGSIIGYTVVFNRLFNGIMSDPAQRQAFLNQIEEAMRQQPNGQQLDPASIEAMLGIAGPVTGLCVGLLTLVFALALGALGGWLAARNRTQTTPPFVPPSDPMIS